MARPSRPPRPFWAAGASLAAHGAVIGFLLLRFEATPSQLPPAATIAEFAPAPAAEAISPAPAAEPVEALAAVAPAEETAALDALPEQVAADAPAGPPLGPPPMPRFWRCGSTLKAISAVGSSSSGRSCNSAAPSTNPSWT